MPGTARDAACAQGLLGHGRTVTADCPACGRTRARLWTREGSWKVVKCDGCGLLITWPRPTAEELSHFYGDEAYYDERGMGGEASAGARDRALDLKRRFPTATSILDFGAGEGHLVQAFRDLGLSAEGVEPAASGRDAALRLHGLALGPDLAAAAGSPWDLVVLMHSLEHVSDPLETLRSIASRVAPGAGLLVEVPHAGSVEMWRRADRRKILDLPAHLFHFTPETLAPIVRRAGFDVTQIRLINCSWLEALLRARERRGDRPLTIPIQATAAPTVAAEPRGLTRRLWRDRALPWLRRVFPGWKFQVVAARRG